MVTVNGRNPYHMRELVVLDLNPTSNRMDSTLFINRITLIFLKTVLVE